MAGIKIVDLPAVGRDLAATDLFEMSLAGGTGSRKITGQEIMNASKLSVNNTPVINGTAGRIFFQGSTNVLQQSAGLSWDDVNSKLILGPTGGSGIIAFPNTTSGFSPVIQSQFGGNSLLFLIGGRTFNLNGGGTITTNFNTTITGSTGTAALVVAQGNSAWSPVADFNGSSGTALRVNTNGNVLIGTTTDAGYKLDVNGTFRASDSLIASSSGGGAYKLTVQHTGTGQGNTFRVIQLGYSMIDVNTSGVSFMPFPSASGTVGITNWTSTGGSGLTFFTKNSEFTPQGGAQALPLIKFPNPSAPIVMGATATVDLRAYLTVSGAFNATSGLASGQQILPTLTATANNDVLVGLDINPTFTNGAFTGTARIGARIQNSRFLIIL